MSEVDSALIYRGFWINHKYGPILGSTITLDQDASNLLVALLAIVVSVAAGAAWDLLLFAVHQLRATKKPKNGLFRQQQVLLRTLATPGSFLIDSLKLMRVWGFEGRHAAVKCLFTAVIALAFTAGGVVAGVFSSYIVSNADLEVLVHSSKCQDFNNTGYWLDSIADVQDYNSAIISDAKSYSDNCYAPGPVPSYCGFYVSPRISPQASREPCPFSQDMCLDNTTEAFVLDSGLLDSNDVFGVNAPPHERVQFRRKITCSPLDVRHHMDVLPASDPRIAPTIGRAPWTDEVVWALNYGQDLTNTQPGYNWTLTHSSMVSNATVEYTTDVRLWSSSPELNITNTYIPLEDLMSDDADLALIVIASNRVIYSSPVDDPIYSAHIPYHDDHTITTGGNVTWYLSDLPVGVLGCKEQYQYCVSTTNGSQACSSLIGSIFDGFKELLPSASPLQVYTLNMLGSIGGLGNLEEVTPAYLNASAAVVGGFADPLPDDQWTYDVAKMEGFVLAGYQTTVALHATGFPGAESMLIPPTTDAQKTLCASQKVIKPAGFANISVFGLAFTLAVSGVLVLLDFGILRLLILYADLRKRPYGRLAQWFEDGVFQVQRAAYQAYSDDLWGKTDNEIPHTAQDVLLPSLGTYDELRKTTLLGRSWSDLSKKSWEYMHVAGKLERAPSSSSEKDGSDHKSMKSMTSIGSSHEPHGLDSSTTLVPVSQSWTASQIPALPRNPLAEMQIPPAWRRSQPDI